MSEPVGLKCPHCGEPAYMVIGDGDQAFCGNDACDVLSWNPRETLAELEAGANHIEWPK